MKLKITLLSSVVLAVSGCGGSGDNVPGTQSSQVNKQSADPSSQISDSSAYNDVGVHDPSVVKVGDTYYVFGSHLAAAKSTDLMSWELISSIPAGGTVDDSPLFDTYSTEISEGISWTDGFKGNWAADVIQAPNGEFWFYYNHCGQDDTNTVDVIDEVCWSRSYLGLATSANIEGPYVDKGIFLRSGYRDGELATYPVDGVTAYEQAVMPNVIDPAAFYDKDGKLWMTYGSYSGGIFILAMDEDTGMPEANQGYGTHVVGGDFNAIEGSFVIYSEETDYYYLFWSNGGFVATGGYNIRVARSRTPNGPYLDADGNDMVGARVGNNYGTKLLGGFNFDAALGDTSAEWGYRSPGHNSAIYDAELDKYLLFTHTRFPEGQSSVLEGHAVRTHEMWMNNDEWLVVSPHRYAPIEGSTFVEGGELEGDYRLVLQGKDTNPEVHESVYVSIEQNRLYGGLISGTYAGSYVTFEDNDDRIQLTVDGVVYEGVKKWQWSVEEEVLEPVISAMSASGESILLEKQEGKLAYQLVDDIGAALEQVLPSVIKDGSIELPEVGARNAKITWESAKPLVISNDGQITRPNIGEGDQVVAMTAKMRVKGQSLTYTVDVTVPERAALNRVAKYSFEDNLADSTGMFADGQAVGDRPYNTGEIAYAAGQEGQALSLGGASGVRLPSGLINNYEYTVSFWANPTTIAGFIPGLFMAVDEFSVTNDDGSVVYFSDNWVNLLPQGWDGNTMLWSHNFANGSEQWFDGSAGVRINEAEWAHLAVSVNQGFVRVMINGVELFANGNLADLFTGKDDSAAFMLGVNYWDLPYTGLIDEVNFYDAAMSGAAIKALEIDKLDDAGLLAAAVDSLDLGDLSGLIDDIRLPHSGEFASAIAWVSTDSVAIDPISGAVARPEQGQTDAPVTLTATVTFAGLTATKEFAAVVKSKTPPAPIATYSFEDNLDDSQAGFDAGVPVAKNFADTTETPTYVDGVVGKALQLTGDAGNIAVELPNGLVSTHTYAISMWLNTNSKAQFGTALFGYASDSSWISFVPWGPGDTGNAMLWSGTAWFDGQTNTTLNNGEWTHVALVVNAGKFSSYINGELTNTMDNFPDVFTPVGSDAAFGIGTNLWADAIYDGLIDELSFYNEPLSAENVKQLYDAGVAVE